jgi:hypothetical protein
VLALYLWLAVFIESYIARYWKDPHKFRPERFLGDWPRDAFISFSQGLSVFRSLQHRNHDLNTLCRCPRLRWETVRIVVVKLRAEYSHASSRFSETEAIAVINMIVSRYRFEVKEEPEFAGETFEQRYARITAFEQYITTT